MEPVHADDSFDAASKAVPMAPPPSPAALGSNAASVPTFPDDKHYARKSRAGQRSSWLAWITAWLRDSETASWLASGLVHLGLVVVLSALAFSQRGAGPDWTLEGVPQADLADDLEVDLSALDAPGGEFSAPRDTVAAAVPLESPGNSALIEPAAPSLASTALPAEQGLASSTQTLDNLLASLGGGIEGRDYENRRSLALAGGGTVASEEAVERGLAWLAAHQVDNGSWSFLFDAARCPQCSGKCRNPGVLESTTASTGLALLCFLGAGYTHEDGPYQDAVRQALYYLVDVMYVTSVGGDLRDRSMVPEQAGEVLLVHKSGDMYSQAIATLALCEAYAMTADENLAGPAQKAVDFIVYAQHDRGGWRYEPKQPGDTSVTGWQLTALKSAVIGNLHVPREVWYRASDFLDGVQKDRGAGYGYQDPSQDRPAMNAVGLFSRMILGWPRSHQPLLKGAAQIASQQPRRNSIYYNYYASQVLHHVGGRGWERWNPRMRDFLVETQETDGHEEGSWYFQEAWSDRGGRLYTTTLAILTLEVYYRYMPMYQQEFIDRAP